MPSRRAKPRRPPRVLQAAKSLSSEMKRTLDDMDGALEKARSLLSRQPSLVEVDPVGKLRPIEDNWQPEKGMLATNHGKGPFGTYLYQGERALQKRKPAGGPRPLPGSQDGGGQDRGEPQARRSPARPDRLRPGRKKVKAPPFDPIFLAIDSPISQTPKELTAFLNSESVFLSHRGGSLNPVFDVREGRRANYLFKVISTEEEELSEIVAPHLFKAVGGKAPVAVRVRGVKVDYVNPKTKHRVTGARDGILLRYIEGTKSMGALTEPEIYAMKEDLAKMRVFRLWLADTDPHMGNFLVAANGEDRSHRFRLCKSDQKSSPSDSSQKTSSTTRRKCWRTP